MFDFLTKAIDNALSIPAAIINGEDVSRKQIAKLISDSGDRRHVWHCRGRCAVHDRRRQP